MKIKPVLTEKSLNDAQNGKYTFWVPKGLTKKQIKKAVSELFGVHVVRVHTMNYKARVTTSLKKKKRIRARKKAIVSLQDKEKIEIFGEEKQNKK